MPSWEEAYPDLDSDLLDWLKATVEEKDEEGRTIPRPKYSTFQDFLIDKYGETKGLRLAQLRSAPSSEFDQAIYSVKAPLRIRDAQRLRRFHCICAEICESHTKSQVFRHLEPDVPADPYQAESVIACNNGYPALLETDYLAIPPSPWPFDDIPLILLHLDPSAREQHRDKLHPELRDMEQEILAELRKAFGSRLKSVGELEPYNVLIWASDAGLQLHTDLQSYLDDVLEHLHSQQWLFERIISTEDGVRRRDYRIGPIHRPAFVKITKQASGSGMDVLFHLVRNSVTAQATPTPMAEIIELFFRSNELALDPLDAEASAKYWQEGSDSGASDQHEDTVGIHVVGRSIRSIRSTSIPAQAAEAHWETLEAALEELIDRRDATGDLEALESLDEKIAEIRAWLAVRNTRDPDSADYVKQYDNVRKAVDYALRNQLKKKGLYAIAEHLDKNTKRGQYLSYQAHPAPHWIIKDNGKIVAET